MEILASTLVDNILPTLVMQLFILSMISERVTNFIKLNLPTTAYLGNFKQKEPNEADEKKRERGVLNWAIIMGLLTAICAKADLFTMLKEGDLAADWKRDPEFWVGITLTGLFISLGSKFWHDLLDLLLEVKNLKGKLNTVKDLEISRSQEFDEFLQTFESEEARKVVVQLHDQLFRIQGVVGVCLRSDKNGYYCEVAVTDTNVVLPQNQFYYYPPGNVKRLRLEPLVVGRIRTMARKIPVSPGDEIGIVATQKARGTLGCLVYRSGNPLWLTCYHVVKSPSQQWEGYDPTLVLDKVENPDDDKNIIGVVKEARRNMVHDIALVAPDINRVDPRKSIPKEIGIVTQHIESGRLQEGVTQVKKFGTISGLTFGKVDKIAYSALIDYEDGEQHTLFELIRIKRDESSARFSAPGDSGSLVVDTSNKAVGVIVAGSDDGIYSFAIPIDSVLNQFSVSFNPASK